MVSALFEAALRPGELLTMKVGSVEFRDECCIITVNGKTGLKRTSSCITYASARMALKASEERRCRRAVIGIFKQKLKRRLRKLRLPP